MSNQNKLDRHLARVLLLASSATRASQPLEVADVVTLDFAVRFPNILLETAQRLDLAVPELAMPSGAEAYSLERAAAGYKFSLDTKRYEPILLALVGMRLLDRTSRAVAATPRGIQVSESLKAQSAWTSTAARCELLGSMLASNQYSLRTEIMHSLPKRYIESDRPLEQPASEDAA